MSRRHRGRSRHGRPRPDGPRTATGTASSAATPAPGSASESVVSRAAEAPQASSTPPDRAAGQTPAASPADRSAPATPTPGPIVDVAPHSNGHAHLNNGQNGSTGCTAPQLRRFIKSRPYVPMHELRRRFAIVADDDDVTRVSVDAGAIYVGLPAREGALLGELLRGGEIGYELSLDPRTPIVIGVYPMRPVPRT